MCPPPLPGDETTPEHGTTPPGAAGAGPGSPHWLAGGRAGPGAAPREPPPPPRAGAASAAAKATPGTRHVTRRKWGGVQTPRPHHVTSVSLDGDGGGGKRAGLRGGWLRPPPRPAVQRRAPRRGLVARGLRGAEASAPRERFRVVWGLYKQSGATSGHPQCHRGQAALLAAGGVPGATAPGAPCAKMHPQGKTALGLPKFTAGDKNVTGSGPRVSRSFHREGIGATGCKRAFITIINYTSKKSPLT